MRRDERRLVEASCGKTRDTTSQPCHLIRANLGLHILVRKRVLKSARPVAIELFWSILLGHDFYSA